LLEAEEFEDTCIDGGMEPEAALVWANRAVELKPESPVDVDITLIILPRHAEHNLSFRLDQSLKNLSLNILRMFLKHRAQTIQHLFDRLKELRLTGVTFQDLLINVLGYLVSSHFDSLH
jgi:hypothetical protein